MEGRPPASACLNSEVRAIVPRAPRAGLRTNFRIQVSCDISKVAASMSALRASDPGRSAYQEAMARTPRETLAPLTRGPLIGLDAAGEPASRVRRTVVAFAASLAVLTYVDRVCIAQA